MNDGWELNSWKAWYDMPNLPILQISIFNIMIILHCDMMAILAQKYRAICQLSVGLNFEHRPINKQFTCTFLNIYALL